MVIQRPSYLIQRIGNCLFNWVAIIFISYALTLSQIASANDVPENKTLIIGSEQDFPPFATGMTNTEAGGFTVELWKAVATEAQLKYTIQVKPFHQILEEFKLGKIDVLINLAISDERSQFADFSVSHVVVHGAVFTRKGNAGIFSENDLANKSIIVLKADLAHDYAISKNWTSQLVLVDTVAEGMHLLSSGKHDAMLVSKLTGMQALQANNISNIRPLPIEVGFAQKFAFATHKDTPELLSRINEALAITKVNGTYDVLYEKWFGIFEPHEVSLNDVLKYLLPVLLIFFGMAQYGIYRRNIERKVAHKALQESETHLRLSQLAGAVGTWEHDLINNKQTWSENCIKLLGLTPQNAPTWDDFLNLVHTDDKQKVIEATKLHIENDTSYDVEYRAVTANGEIRWIRSAGQVEYNDAGTPIIMRGIAQDITERKYAEYALQASEERFRILLQSIPSISVQGYQEDGTTIYWNKASEYLYGYSADEAIGQNLLDLIIPKEMRQDVQADIQKMFASGEPMPPGELSLKKKDGSYVDVFSSHAYVHVPGKAPEMFCVDIDLTERKIAENEFRIAATVFESQEGMMVTDANSIILRVNRAFCAITGYHATEVIGKTPNLLSSGHHDKEFYDQMWQDISHHGAWEGEIWNRRKNGEVYPEHLTINAVKDAHGVITNYIATLTDITMSKAAAEEIQNLAFFDPLTNLPNRRLLIDRLKHALASSSRSGKQGAILFLDLDHFKMLNDTMGHDLGDLLLKQVADKLINCVREGDTVARLGGDEFVVMLENLSELDFDAASQTEVIANKILFTLNQPVNLVSHEYQISTSIGITLFDGQTTAIEDLLKQADISMYQAKKEGRNTLRFFNPQMQANITERVLLERELSKAIEKNQLHLYYQVQTNHLNQPLGAEALIRWIHPELGLISPLQFIPLAEENGLIIPIGNWVLEEACKQISAWQLNKKTCHFTLSVNVSAKQFHQVNFVSHISALITQYQIDSKLLKLEMTESMLLDHVEEIIENMQALKEIGVQFSLDDFGTGYSSLQYLKQLPLYQLKIDQSFVRDIAIDPSDQAIVRTIIAISKSLELDVIAEGVETEEQRSLLMKSHCTRYQGYLFGKPMPIEQFNAALSI